MMSMPTTGFPKTPDDLFVAIDNKNSKMADFLMESLPQAILAATIILATGGQ